MSRKRHQTTPERHRFSSWLWIPIVGVVLGPLVYEWDHSRGDRTLSRFWSWGQQLAPEPFEKVSMPDFSICHNLEYAVITSPSSSPDSQSLTNLINQGFTPMGTMQDTVTATGITTFYFFFSRPKGGQ